MRLLEEGRSMASERDGACRFVPVKASGEQHHWSEGAHRVVVGGEPQERIALSAVLDGELLNDYWAVT